MQELRYILVALGGIAIAALLIHGLWSNRKNRQAPIKEKPLGRLDTKSRNRDDDVFDSDGIGQVRVVSGSRRAEPRLHHDEGHQPEFGRRAAEPAFGDDDDDDDELSSVVRKPAAHPVPPPADEEDLRFDEPEPEAVPQEPAAPARKPAQVNRRTPIYRSRPQREPMMQSPDEELLDESAPAFDAHSESVHTPEPALKEQPRHHAPGYVEPTYELLVEQQPVVVKRVKKIWQDVYVINLMGRPGQELQGATLLASLIAQGFKFGDMDIFHRHEDANGKGEVLFSAINMVKPGTFNPYRMEQFTTPGVSLFMQLPLRNNAAFAFEEMLQVADQLAGDLDAMLTDMDRSPLSDETIARYRQELAIYESNRD